MTTKRAFTIIGYVLLSFSIVGILAYGVIWFQNWEWGQMEMFHRFWWICLPSFVLAVVGMQLAEFGESKSR